jgi:signal transduction histidine kinase
VADVWPKRLLALRITPWGAALFSVLSIIAVPIADVSAGDTAADFALELGLGAIATSALWAVVWPGIIIARRVMRPGWLRQMTIFSVIVLGGAIRGGVIFWWGTYFSFDSEAPLSQRLLNSITTTVVWLILLSLFFHAAEHFKRRYGTLFRQVALARASQTSHTEVSKILGGLEESLRGVASKPGDEAVAREEMARIAHELEREVVASIRHYSKSLWSFEAKRGPRLRFWPLLHLAIARLQYSLGFVVVVFVVVGIPNVGSVVGLAEATWRVLLAAIVLWVWHVAYWKVVVPRITTGLLSNTLYLLSLGAVVQIPMGVPWYLMDRSVAAPLFILLLTLPIAALPVVDSALRLAELARGEVLDVLETPQPRQGTKEDDPEGTVPRSNLAAYLHNSLQSEIQGIILALKAAASRPDQVHIGQASLQRLRLLSNRSLDEQFASFKALPIEHLHQVIAGWRGVLDISLSWEADTDSGTDPRIATVVHIIEEVASNAAVRAGATEMDVRVVNDDGGYVVTCSSNAPLKTQGKSGLGSTWLHSFAETNRGNRRLGEYSSQTFRVT